MVVKRIRKLVMSILCLSILLLSSSTAFALNTNAIGTDTAKGDKDFPTTMSSFAFKSAGHDLYGIIYMAEGKGPHPTMMLLHGFPGNEKMLDIAHALRRAGINSVFFAYRGAWGSGGDFSYSNCIEDAMAAVDFLRSPEITAKYRIDPSKLIISGHSMGGFVTFNLAKLLKDVNYFISYSGWNLGAYGKRLAAADAATTEKVLAWLAGSAVPLNGTSNTALRDEILRLKDSHDLIDYVPALADKKILMIGAKQDIPVPMQYDHIPLYDALKKSYPNNVEEFVVDDDHAYSATRIAVMEATLNWLKKQGF
jgi:Dipeptidyl aminopeptidases/acylaminoacyl-peptidases